MLLVERDDLFKVLGFGLRLHGTHCAGRDAAGTRNVLIEGLAVLCRHRCVEPRRPSPPHPAGGGLQFVVRLGTRGVLTVVTLEVTEDLNFAQRGRVLRRAIASGTIAVAHVDQRVRDGVAVDCTGYVFEADLLQLRDQAYELGGSALGHESVGMAPGLA